MTHNHWDLVFLFLFLVALGLAVVWTVEYFFPTDTDLLDANNYEDDQEELSRIIREPAIAEYHYEAEEVVNPYDRIEALEHEIHGYLVQIDTLHGIIYSLRQNPSAKPQNAESRLGVKNTEGLGDSTAQEITGDCA